MREVFISLWTGIFCASHVGVSTVSDVSSPSLRQRNPGGSPNSSVVFSQTNGWRGRKLWTAAETIATTSKLVLLLDACNCFLVLPFPRWYVPNFAFASLLRFVFINFIPNSVPNTTLLLRNYLSKVCCLWWRFHWIIINTNQRIARKSPVVVCLCFIILFLTDFSLYHVVTRGRGGEWWWCWRWRRGMKHFNRKESSKKI